MTIIALVVELRLTSARTAVPLDVTSSAIPYHSRLSGNRSRITTGITCCVHTSGALFRSVGGGVVRVDRHDGSVMQRPAFLAPELETTLCETQGAPLRAGCLPPKGEWRQGFNDSNGARRAHAHSCCLEAPFSSFVFCSCTKDPRDVLRSCTLGQAC